jgi:hypothetical protein
MQRMRAGETMRALAGLLAVLGLVALGAACSDKRSRGTQGPTSVDGVTTFRALLIDGHLYPSDQFRLANADVCDDFHWHKSRPAVSIGMPAAGDTITCAPGSAVRPDPAPGSCGFGRISDLPSTAWRTTNACYMAWQNAEWAVP